MSQAGDGDKRSVTTDALETLGKIIGPKEARDAIHLAVEPVIAAERLYPGQDVGLLHDGKACGNDAATKSGHVGIVDPFLKNPVMPGERFWLVIYPRKIHSLRHVWTHPAFPDVAEVNVGADSSPPESAPVTHTPEELERARQATVRLLGPASERWLRDWCSRNDCPGFDEVRDAILKGRVSGPTGSYDEGGYTIENQGDYIMVHGTDAHASIPAEFWDHFERATGVHIPEGERAEGFSCSC